jgi:hypothetical protein
MKEISELHALVEKVSRKDEVVQDMKKRLIIELIALNITCVANTRSVQDRSPFEFNTGKVLNVITLLIIRLINI